MPGITDSIDPSRIQRVTIAVESPSPRTPHGCTNGLWTCGCEYRNFSAAGKIHKYESNVVEMAMSRTTTNFALSPPWNAASATTQKTDAATPDMTLTRMGVPSFLLKTPKYGKNAPS